MTDGAEVVLSNEQFSQLRAGYMPVAKTTDWETPPALFDALDAEFGPFTLDPACMPNQYSAGRILSRGTRVSDGMDYDGTICVPSLTDGGRWAIDPLIADRVKIDGLLQDWSGVVFLNPPYGREMPAWIAKAVHEIEAGHAVRVVALIPARTDTAMWQKYICKEFVWEDIDWTAQSHPKLRALRFLGKSSPGMEGRSRVRFGGAPAGAPFPCAVVVWER